MTRRPRSVTWHRTCAPFVAAALAALVGCGPPKPKGPLPTRPIDEGRAAKIIAEALHKEGLKPAPPRTIRVAGRAELTLDVSVEGRKFGVVYLTANDATELGNNPLARKSKVEGDPLRIETGGGDDGEVHFVVLYASDYVYDDVAGTSHEETTITAESKLDRDTRDFVMLAQKHKWP